ncbi:hypothetical protein HYC85_003395 [Camellia sinensis]|uniref:Pentacotripeptide-repeat region of PRORP domain-containing protein n=1 Tax=Camellia sinensis TaxID=4442 RepID=A0A7J7ICD2_CAMSI|nr:hypothetical protein HYC85_003395 [Camellia sinensis]
MQEISTTALISGRRLLAHNYRKGITFLPSLNFNFNFNFNFSPLLSADNNNILLFHSQILTNPNPNPNPPDLSQLRKLLSQKSKLGFDKLDDALSLFHRMVQMQPLPPVIHFNQLLSGIAKMKHYSSVISLFKEIRLLGITVDFYTVNIVIERVHLIAVHGEQRQVSVVCHRWSHPGVHPKERRPSHRPSNGGLGNALRRTIRGRAG